MNCKTNFQHSSCWSCRYLVLKLTIYTFHTPAHLELSPLESKESQSWKWFIKAGVQHKTPLSKTVDFPSEKVKRQSAEAVRVKSPRSLWGLNAKVWSEEGRIIGLVMQREQADANACWQCDRVSISVWNIRVHAACGWFPLSSFRMRMQSAPAGFMHNTPHSPGLLHKVWELFIEYLAHSSFKDFALG